MSSCGAVVLCRTPSIWGPVSANLVLGLAGAPGPGPAAALTRAAVLVPAAAHAPTPRVREAAPARVPDLAAAPGIECKVRRFFDFIILFWSTKRPIINL